jgi:universal stress protein A
VEKAGVPAIAEVRGGAPSAQIIRAAIDWGADLIVMATHGKTGLAPLVIGRIADHVVRHAPCPVLVVRDAALQHPQTTRSQQENVA